MLGGVIATGLRRYLDREIDIDLAGSLELQRGFTPPSERLPAEKHQENRLA